MDESNKLSKKYFSRQYWKYVTLSEEKDKKYNAKREKLNKKYKAKINELKEENKAKWNRMAESYKAKAKELSDDITYRFTDILTTSKQPDINKCTCEAKVRFNTPIGQEIEGRIRYVVQIGENGETYAGYELL